MVAGAIAGVINGLARDGLSEEVLGKDPDVLVGTAVNGVEAEDDGAIVAEFVAVAVAGVQHVLDAARAERNEAEAMGEEFIGEDGSVGLDLHEIDGDSRDLGQHGAAQAVSEGERGVVENEIDGSRAGVADRHLRPALIGPIAVFEAVVVHRHHTDGDSDKATVLRS